MTSPSVDRRFGLVGNATFKAPVTALAHSNITLSGQQTIDGVALLATNSMGVPDRVLCVSQTNPVQNGIYDVSLNAWTRSVDANGQYDLTCGSGVYVQRGTTYQRTVWHLTTNLPITIGTTALTWELGIAEDLLVSAANAAAQAALAAASASAAAVSAAAAAGYLDAVRALVAAGGIAHLATLDYTATNFISIPTISAALFVFFDALFVGDTTQYVVTPGVGVTVTAGIPGVSKVYIIWI